MLLNPKILKRAQEEMDQVIGRNRRLQESDIKNLPYLQAICKESFRKHPSTPLNLPRISSEACEVNGYYIPKGTRLSVNIWGIGRDPDVWENPLEFNPDRFLTGKNAKIDPRGNDFELIPFGAGRRICAGTRMGVVMVEYFLGTFVHSFDWKLPEGMTELNMDESFGLALQKAVPLAAVVTPRLQPSAYAVRNGFALEEDPHAPPGQRFKLKSVPFSKNITFGVADVKDLISILADSHGECSIISSYKMDTSDSVCPPRVRAMLASRACRSSVMIGDPLGRNEMQKILEHLVGLNSPWNCPHGRPTMRHLVDLTTVRKFDEDDD